MYVPRLASTPPRHYPPTSEWFSHDACTGRSVKIVAAHQVVGLPTAI